jgi:hypothetical protein
MCDERRFALDDPLVRNLSPPLRWDGATFWPHLSISDFSSRMLLAQPPPKVGHIRIGNLSMRAFHESLTARWPVILELSSANKLVVVHHDRIECVL